MVARNLIGVVLAGGASRRMRRDKAILQLGGETLVARAARRLAGVSSEVLIAGAGRHAVEGFESVLDGPGGGPVAGILGAYRERPNEALLVLACDLPRVPETLLSALTQTREADWVVPRWKDGVEPLCALYHHGALEVLEKRVASKRFALYEMVAEPLIDVAFLDGTRLEQHGHPEEMFLNVNTPADWRALNSRPE